MSEEVFQKEFDMHLNSCKEQRDKVDTYIKESSEVMGSIRVHHKLLSDMKDENYKVRVTLLEDLTGRLSKNIWIVAVVGGLCGGFVSHLIPEVISLAVKAVFK